eukprot:354987-Chlamydomonas_euryale.AAC.8
MVGTGSCTVHGQGVCQQSSGTSVRCRTWIAGGLWCGSPSIPHPSVSVGPLHVSSKGAWPPVAHECVSKCVRLCISNSFSPMPAHLASAF